jgi:hypothetical protein
MNLQGEHFNGLGSPLSDTSFKTHVSALSKTSEAMVVSKYAPDEYERTTYYQAYLAI